MYCLLHFSSLHNIQSTNHLAFHLKDFQFHYSFSLKHPFFSSTPKGMFQYNSKFSSFLYFKRFHFCLEHYHSVIKFLFSSIFYLFKFLFQRLLNVSSYHYLLINCITNVFLFGLNDMLHQVNNTLIQTRGSCIFN